MELGGHRRRHFLPKEKKRQSAVQGPARPNQTSAAAELPGGGHLRPGNAQAEAYCNEQQQEHLHHFPRQFLMAAASSGRRREAFRRGCPPNQESLYHSPSNCVPAPATRRRSASPRIAPSDRAITCHGIISISHCQDTGTERYCIPFQTVGVS